MRMPSIIDWLKVIAVIEFAQLLVSAATLALVAWLFKTHDGSVLQKLDAFIAVVREKP